MVSIEALFSMDYSTNSSFFSWYGQVTGQKNARQAIGKDIWRLLFHKGKAVNSQETHHTLGRKKELSVKTPSIYKIPLFL